MRMQLTLPPHMAQLRAVRRVLEGWAAAHNLAPDTLCLIATELVANSIAVSPADETIELTAQLVEEAVTIVVADSGPGFDGSRIHPVGPGSRRGRGLHIVASLSNRVTVERTGGRTVVTAHQYRRMLGPLPDQHGSDPSDAGAHRDSSNAPAHSHAGRRPGPSGPARPVRQ